LSKGDNVYVTLESPETRHVTSTYQVAAPDHDRAENKGTPSGGQSGTQRILIPIAFCRECGQEYLVVTRGDTRGHQRFAARRDNDASGGDEAGGYLFISDDQQFRPHSNRYSSTAGCRTPGSPTTRQAR
jgi:hypothetical protein